MTAIDHPFTLVENLARKAGWSPVYDGNRVVIAREATDRELAASGQGAGYQAVDTWEEACDFDNLFDEAGDDEERLYYLRAGLF